MSDQPKPETKPKIKSGAKTKSARKKKPQSLLLLCGEGLVLILLLVCVGISVLVWRISQEPVDIGFAKPYIEQAVKDANAGFELKVDQVYLEWPDFKGQILVGLGNVSLIGEDQTEILSVESAGIGLSYTQLLLGSVRPTALIINNPALQVDRTQDDIGIRLQNVDLMESDKEAHKEKSDEIGGTLQQEIASTLIEITDRQFASGTFFSNLERVEVRNAEVVLNDQVRNIRRTFTNMNASLARSNLGASLSTTLEFPESDNASMFSMTLDYIKNQQRFVLDSNLQSVDPFLFGEFFHHAKIFAGQDVRISGTASAVFDEALNPLSVGLNLGSPAGVLQFEGEYEEPLPFRDAKAVMRYNASEQLMQIEALDIIISDVPVQVRSSAQFGNDSISIPVTLTIPSLTAAKATSLIPASEKDSDGGQWVGQKLRDGTYKNITVNIGYGAERQNVVGPDGPRKPWVWGLKSTDASFDFENLTIDYSDTLTPATEAFGTGKFDGDNLVITGPQAKVGAVTGSNLNMVFSDFMVVGGGMADITMDVSGPLPAYLRFLSLDPINLGEDIGLDPETVKGTLAAKMDVQFPTLKEVPKEQVSVKVEGTLSDLILPDMIRGLPLSGGPLSLTVSGGRVDVKGKGMVANRPVDVDWAQFLDSTGQPFSMQVKAKIAADQELRNHFGIDLDEFISGTIPVDLVYTEQASGDAVIDLTGDLQPMGIGIEVFDFQKPSGAAGNVTLKAILKNEVLQRIENLNLKTAGLDIQNATLTFRNLGQGNVEIARAELPSAAIGQTRQAVDLQISPDDTWTIKSNGSVFDAGPFLKDQEPGAQAPNPADNPYFKISLSADRMLTKKDQALRDTKLYLELDRRVTVNQLEVDGRAGDGTVYVRYKPNAAGQRNFHMEATDAGATLKTFDIFPDLIGGKMTIYGEPIGGANGDDIYGVAQIENFRVVNTPALAKLISAMSLTGLDKALSGEGLSFEKLEGQFEWLFRPQGSMLAIKEGRTSGSSLGLSFEGKVDRADQTIDIKGTIIPLSGVNNILGSIPLVGEILTGGSGLIAATYTMRGPATEPRVVVNPLSVLTPGFIRRILFEGGFDENVTLPQMPNRTAPVQSRQNQRTPTSEELLQQRPVNE